MPTELRLFLFRSEKALQILRKGPILDPTAFISPAVVASPGEIELLGGYGDRKSILVYSVEEKFDNEHCMITVFDKQVNTTGEVDEFFNDFFKSHGDVLEEDVMVFLGLKPASDNPYYKQLLYWEDLKLSKCTFSCLKPICRHREFPTEFKKRYKFILKASVFVKSLEGQSTGLISKVEEWIGGSLKWQEKRD